MPVCQCVGVPVYDGIPVCEFSKQHTAHNTQHAKGWMPRASLFCFHRPRTVRIHCIGRRVAKDPFEFNHIKNFLPQSKDIGRQRIAATRIHTGSIHTGSIHTRINTSTLPHTTSNPGVNTVAANPVRLEIGSGEEDTSALEKMERVE